MSKTEDDWDELLRAVALLAGEVEGQSEGRCTPASATTARQVIALIQPLCQRPTTYTDGEGGIIFIWRGECDPTFLLMDNRARPNVCGKGLAADLVPRLNRWRALLNELQVEAIAASQGASYHATKLGLAGERLLLPAVFVFGIFDKRNGEAIVAEVAVAET